MKNMFYFIAIVSIIIGNNLSAQTAPDSVYYNKLYYTGKIWGFVKYFHSEVAKGGLDWDTKLLNTITDVKGSITNEDFNNVLKNLLEQAGEMALPATPLPEIPDSLKYNLELSWLHDTIFSDEIQTRLESIASRFRPQSNYYVGDNLTFDNDNKFYEWNDPPEEYRLLALFRYWNIINYFFPYKYIIDQHWDSTLVEFIPKVINAQNKVPYHLTIMELVTRINDTHGIISSFVMDNDIVGYYYLPLALKYVDNETVITSVYIENSGLKVGDIIKSIDGKSIYAVRDSLRKYIAASNISALERNINTRIIRGQPGTVQLTVENSEGKKQIALNRNSSMANYSELIRPKGAVWKIIDRDSGKYGYVDMGRLQVAQLADMFTELWNTDAIIFDIRNYPNSTLWSMISYLFNEPIHIAKFTVPNRMYPGTIYWNPETIGFGDFSQTYDKNIFVLFDERTQSQAEYTVMGLEQHPNAIKIGSQTAGADGNVSKIYLPGRIYTYFTGLGVFYPDYTETQRIGIVPDIEVHPTVAGIRDGYDEVLETALQYPATAVDHNLCEQNQMPNIYLYPNYPNPFNSATTIKYDLPESNKVILNIYNISGQQIETLISEFQTAGEHEITWHANGLPSGIYIYRLRAGVHSETKKIILQK